MPVRHNSPCQNRKRGHDSSPQSPALRNSNRQADVRSFSVLACWRLLNMTALLDCLENVTKVVKKVILD